MADSVMKVILLPIATVATPQATEFGELKAEVASLRRQLSDLTGHWAVQKQQENLIPIMFSIAALGMLVPQMFQRFCYEIHTSMHQAGKQLGQQLGATSVAGHTQSCLFYITDRASGLKFLIDTGLEISVVPRLHTHRETQCKGPSLQAINNTPNGFTYLLTCVDRFTHWPEAILIAEITTETVANTFVAGWVARFGVPSVITTDRGGQTQSHLWQHLVQLLGTKQIWKVTYHPIANGLVECFHCQLMVALKCQCSQKDYGQIGYQWCC